MIEKVEERESSSGCEGRIASQGPASVRKERGRGTRERSAFIPTHYSSRLPEDQATSRARSVRSESGRQDVARGVVIRVDEGWSGCHRAAVTF